MQSEIGWAYALRDLVLSSRCLVCGDPESIARRDVCANCLEQWHAAPRSIGHALWGIRPYDRISQRVILGVKDRGLAVLQLLLAESIALACAPMVANHPGPALLVPVPSRPQAIRKRGADVLWEIAQTSADLLRHAGAEVTAARLLTHSRPVADQGGLDAAARQRNVSGALTVAGRRINSQGLSSRELSTSGLSKRSVRLADNVGIMVIDDLITTGATMKEAMRALSEVGHVVGGACAASTHIPSPTLPSPCNRRLS